ncbi:hypothetical protein [Halosimplex salinum]|uniref:hypothetical protein n=1 Tax=Halosimplex salinum TaxID=1710538 RepID=UPI000F468A88|nr:hypothetical protein [Halosimplex salinum]
MVSRDTAVHVTVVVLAFASVAALSRFGTDFDSPLGGLLLVVFNGAVLAGAHLYLAWRGDDGLVPVAARWRFVAAVAAVLFLGLVAVSFDPVSLGPVSSNALLAALGGVVAVGYLLAEARAGYLASTGDSGV